MSTGDAKNILVICILGGLATYCLMLQANELASVCVGALAGILTQRSPSVTPPPEPPKGETP